MSSDTLRNRREAAPGTLPEHVPPAVQEALREAKERLQKTYGERLRRVVLYGSQARDEARHDSDIDVLVVLEDPIENSYREIKRTADISVAAFEQHRLHLSLQHYSEAEYQAHRDPFMQNVQAEGIEL